MKSRLNSVFVRIFAATSSVCAAAIAAGAFAAYSELEKTVERNTERMLSDSVALLASCINAGTPAENIAKAVSLHPNKSGIRTTIISRNGDIVFDSSAGSAEMLNHLDRHEVKNALEGRVTSEKRYSQTMRSNFIYIAAPAGARKNGTFEYCVRQSMNLKIPNARKSVLKNEIILFAVAAEIFAMMLSLLLARKISKPLAELAEAASRFAEGDFEARVPRSSVAEIGILSKSLFKMGRDLKKRINSLRKRNCELDEVFSQMRDCVFICSDNGDVRRYNRACSELFSIPEDIRNPRTAGVFRNSAVTAAIEKTFAENKPVSVELEHLDGSYKLTGLPLPYSAKHARALFVIRDISQEKRNELLRREFVAGASHELKTPITAIKIAAETIAENFDETARRFVPTIEKEADRMTAIVDEMLLLSRLEFSDARENFAPFDLSAAVKTALSNNENQMEINGDTAENNCQSPLKIVGDAHLAEIAVGNLVSNAVRYGGKGCKISVSAHEDEKFVSITVSDTGMGISEDDLPRVFERFFRVDKGRSRALGGTGLGLALVKHIAILHGGSVSAQSRLGKGSSFTITFAKA